MWRFSIVFLAFLAMLTGFACYPDDEMGDELFSESPKVLVRVRDMTAQDGAVLKVFAFTSTRFFYIPSATARGHARISGGEAEAKLDKEMADGVYFIWALIDMDENDGPGPQQGDLLAGPLAVTVVGGEGLLKIDPGQFVDVNVSIRVVYPDPAGEGVEVRVRVGDPNTPCSSDVAKEAFGVIEGGFTIMGVPDVADGDHSVCVLLDLDPGTGVTSIPGGDDLVFADGTGLTVAGGVGLAVVSDTDLHAIPELTLNNSLIPDGTSAIVTIVDIVQQVPQAAGLGAFQNGTTDVPLLFWVLDGAWLAIAIADLDQSGVTSVSVGDNYAAVPVVVNGASVTPSIEESDFTEINLLAHIQISGHDGERVLFGVYTSGTSCTGVPVAVGVPLVLSGGAVTIPVGDVPDGTWDACPVVDVDGSYAPNTGDLVAIHPFTIGGSTEITIVEAEFFSVP